MIISPDKKGAIDPVVYDIIKHIKSDIPIVPITRVENFEFNEDLLNLDRYVLIDMEELGWNWDMKTTHFFGRNTYYFKENYEGEEWGKFDDFISDRQPLLYFKRELLSKDVRNGIFPIEFPAFNPIPEPQTKEQFNSRFLEVCNIWGLSHEGRKRIHGEIWQQAGKHNYIVCDNIHNLNAFIKEEKHPNKWLTQNTPWYARYDMKTILEVTGISKISTSWGGAGRVCFRHTESSVNSVMAMWEDEIAWTYPWINGKNCIRVEEGREIEQIAEALNNPNLYDIYLEGVANCRKYHLPNYIRNYIEPQIKAVL